MARNHASVCGADLVCDGRKRWRGSVPFKVVNVFEKRLVSAQSREILKEQREFAVLIVQSSGWKLFQWTIMVDELRRSLWPTARNSRITVCRIAHERERSEEHTSELQSHSF